jgi:signal transduction histidine kinase
MLILWLQRHPRLVDWVLFLVSLATSAGAAFRRGHGAAAVAVALAGSLPLLVRRGHPLPVLVVATAATIVQVAAWGQYNPLPAGIALVTVADRCDRRTSITAGVATLAVLAPALLTHDPWTVMAGRLLPFVVAWLIGDSIGTRRRYVAALEERAERLEREREAEAARAVAEEQARIGRELHDVIAHNVSVMVVQAAAAEDVFDSRPERAREALRAIESTGRSALEELRSIVGSVRGEAAAYAPQPGLDDLDELVGHLRAAGLPVTVTVEGDPRPLPQSVDLSAYRVVQEALTNTLKHAHATGAAVSLRWLGDELELEIRDDGVGPTNANGGGHGIAGMRERLSLLGGTLVAGPGPGGGFTVVARFPLGTAA